MAENTRRDLPLTHLTPDLANGGVKHPSCFPTHALISLQTPSVATIGRCPFKGRPSSSHPLPSGGTQRGGGGHAVRSRGSTGEDRPGRGNRSHGPLPRPLSRVS